jgi:hypothetical protein
MALHKAFLPTGGVCSLHSPESHEGRRSLSANGEGAV